MSTQSTSTAPPAWFNLHAVVDEATCASVRNLAGRIEAAIDDLAPVFDQCYRTLRQVHDAMATELAGTGDATWDVINEHSGATRLSDLLYLLSAHADGAVGEKVTGHEIPWLEKARNDLGLDEHNVPRR